MFCCERMLAAVAVFLIHVVLGHSGVICGCVIDRRSREGFSGGAQVAKVAL